MSLDAFRLDGKTALITGGNRGIGLAIARLFGEAGAQCMLSARSETPQSRELTNRDGYAFTEGDVTDPAVPERLVQATLDRFGRLDILVNNAGVADGGDFHDFDDKRLARIMDTNLIAPFRVARAAIPPMLAQGGGAIVNIGSISGYVANKPQLQVAYNSSKAAIHQMTTVMAFEYAGRGIRVNALAPGYIRTRMAEGGMADDAMSKVWRDSTPMGRFGEPEEMATCALFLASDAASFVTGATLVADGGYITH
ncbi:glucose 1-dehydrogenase [Rhodobacteraceae bacterium 2CG4]|uniref:Glucose 1-dehydrogenase n=1 Tax=Halovulum marinum TaxID=2662447 RepID=A0A6L5YW46_9RHOB|nr:SDR family oxidoreductase [Halovulum marinum]MSU88437.1 glucose 1-dehydrogenase [Halovulum marinum]